MYVFTYKLEIDVKAGRVTSVLYLKTFSKITDQDFDSGLHIMDFSLLPK